MSVIETWLTRIRWRRRSNGPAKAAIAIGGSARSAVSSVIGVAHGGHPSPRPCHPEPLALPCHPERSEGSRSRLRAQPHRFPHLFHGLFRDGPRLLVARVEHVAHDILRASEKVRALLPDRLKRSIHVGDQVFLAVDASAGGGAALPVHDRD